MFLEDVLGCGVVDPELSSSVFDGVATSTEKFNKLVSLNRVYEVVIAFSTGCVI